MTETSSEREALAIAVLTGQATANESQTFKALISSDPAFRSLVKELETWLAPLGAADPEQPPPQGLRDDILAGLPAVPPAPVRHAPRQAKTVHWAWRPSALLAAALALAAFVLPLTDLVSGRPGNPATTAIEPKYVAALSDSSEARVIVIVYDPGEQRVLARYSNVAPPSDGVWQLWLIRDGEAAPRSLGLLLQSAAEAGESNLDLNEQLVPGQDVLAISLEPVGGSPQPVPTGPVLFTGAVSGAI